MPRAYLLRGETPDLSPRHSILVTDMFKAKEFWEEWWWRHFLPGFMLFVAMPSGEAAGAGSTGRII